jgi:hypothetical protein
MAASSKFHDLRDPSSLLDEEAIVRLVGTILLERNGAWPFQRSR